MLEQQLTQKGLKSKKQGKNEPDYIMASLVFIDDDSVRLVERKTGKEFWASREYKDGKYTGNFVLENGTLITLNTQEQGVEKNFEIGEGKCYTYYEREVAIGNRSGAVEPFLLEEPYHLVKVNERLPMVSREQCENALGQEKICPEFSQCYNQC